MAAVVASTVFWAKLENAFVWIGLLTAGLLTVLGATDDWVKQRTARNGLAAKHKLAVQLIIATAAGIGLRWKLGDGPSTAFVWPFEVALLALTPCFVARVVLIGVSTANAVNLTDGLDGLAAGCTVMCGCVMTVLLYLSSDPALANGLGVAYVAGSGELAVVVGALVGAMLGFLWFNCHPADVFMGDAGALSAGGLLAVAAVVSRQELLLLIAGGVFVAETLSVIVQVSCYRMTGKRPLRCSPLHNHFVFRGDRETRIVTRFWIVAGLLAVTALASLALPAAFQ
jgi:phospho-N-acetylmuramoyl-pentapeptide-transferase